MKDKINKPIILAVTLMFVVACLLFTQLVFPVAKTMLVNGVENRPLSGRVIYIDPGHGGEDSGASYGKVREDVVNLQLSLHLKTALEEAGAVVYLTREDDSDLGWGKNNDLYHRVRKIDEVEPDLFVSIHMNASTSGSAYGAQTFYYKKSTSGKLLAELIQKEFSGMSNTKKKATEGNYYVLRNTAAVGVLVECGFLSNSRERQELQSKNHQKRLAKAIVKGIENYFEKSEKSVDVEE